MDDSICNLTNQQPRDTSDSICDIMVDDNDGISQPATTTLSTTTETTLNFDSQFEVDIADWNKKPVKEIPGDVVELVIRNYPVPEKGYKFRSVCMGNSTKTGKPIHRHFNKDLLNTDEKNFGSWLVWSKKKEGLYCKYCALFEKEANAKRDREKTEWQLIDRPFVDYKKINDVLKNHAVASYHTDFVAAADQWLRQVPNLNFLNHFILTYSKIMKRINVQIYVLSFLTQ